MLSEVSEVVGGSLNPALRLITQAVIAFFVVGLLVVVDPLLALTVSLFIGGVYGLILWGKPPLRRPDRRREIGADRERFRISSEALGGDKGNKDFGAGEVRFASL